MALSEIFSTSFLFSTTIIIILIGCLFAYVSYRMAEQDKQTNSMINIVRNMADEIQLLRDNLNKNQSLNVFQNGGAEFKDSSLISVSDDQDNDIDESQYEYTDDEDEEGDDSDDEDGSEEEGEDDMDEVELIPSDKHIDMDTDDIVSGSISILNLDHGADVTRTVILNTDPAAAPTSTTASTKTISLMEISDDMESIMSDDTDAPPPIAEIPKQDYKKMAVQQLRNIISASQPDLDVSKINKNELLKLLRS